MGIIHAAGLVVSVGSKIIDRDNEIKRKESNDRRLREKTTQERNDEDYSRYLKRMSR